MYADTHTHASILYCLWLQEQPPKHQIHKKDVVSTDTLTQVFILHTLRYFLHV